MAKETTYFQLNNELNIVKNNKIQLNKDKEAVKAFFEEHVKPKSYFSKDVKLKDKLDFLTKNNYIDKKVISMYTEEFLEKIFSISVNKNFKFNSFLGAYKAYNQYVLKTDDGEKYLESFEDRAVFTSLTLANGDENLAVSILNEILDRRFQPATPTFSNAGKARRGEFVSCFIINVEDNMSSIGRSINSSLQLSRIGGGVGIVLTDIRASGDPIKGIPGLSDGVIPIMKLYEDSFSYANQLGTRNGSGAVYLNIFHPDIMDFLSTRKENADEKVRVKMLSLGIVVPDKYYELIKNDSDMYLFSPYSIEKEYGVPMSELDITKEYDNLVKNDNIIKKKIKARELETEISNLQNESGYPYVLNIDHVNRANPIHGVIRGSNLCSEIHQVSKKSKINEDQTYEELGTDISCNLGSTNVEKMMEAKDFGYSIETMFKALNYVSESTNIESVPTVKNGNDLYRSVGLGAMNLHGYLAKNKIHYGSEEALEFTSAYFMLLNYWTLVASNKLAMKTKKTFYEFELSDYASGKYFDDYLERINKYPNKNYQFKSEKVKNLFKNIYIPTLDDWMKLKNKIIVHGLYNSYRLAVAPTGSISYISEATASIHPITNRIEERLEGKRGKAYYPAPGLSDETIPYYISSYDMDQRKIIDTYAEASKHIDQGASMTLFLREDLPEGLYEWKENSLYPTKKTTRDLNILRNYAWKKGVKSIYYIRTHTDGEEIGANECESCSI